MDHIPPFDSAHLESLCRVIADTTDGLTGGEILRILAECKIPDVTPEMTKWKRLFNALVEMQNQKGMGNHAIMVLTRAMKPVRFIASPDLFAVQREKLNAILAFRGMELGDDGQLRRVSAASNLTDALARANRLRASLEARGVHPDVLLYCRAELLQENYFHAVFEAMKSIAAKVRQKSGLVSDGAELITQAFALGKTPLGTPGSPILAINALATDTDRGEQRGFMNLLVGLFGTIRNPTAHNPKIEWPMSEQDALDILTLASLSHRKLDRATRA